MRSVQIIFFYILFIIVANCKHLKEKIKSKNPFPYFRRQVEHYDTWDSNVETAHSGGLRSNLVSFFVNHVKDIFGDNNFEANGSTNSIASELVSSTLKINKHNEADPKLTDDMRYQNLSYNNLLNTDYDKAHRNSRNKMVLSKEMKLLEKSEQMLGENNDGKNISIYVRATTEDTFENKRSCIFCDNIVSENCHDPQKKLVPSTVCERETDLCYSQHTPFGIIDRGCFNVNHNFTTYVCSCNLCNYISISEMPYIFSNKRDWVDNIVDLSRTRNFRKSIFKDMACLRCEVNTSNHRGEVLDSANCLEGSIGSLPTQVCEENEICAVIALRSQGYIWRGCVKTPLYNYWFALCDSDLCNYDTLVSIYDFV